MTEEVRRVIDLIRSRPVSQITKSELLTLCAYAEEMDEAARACPAKCADDAEGKRWALVADELQARLSRVVAAANGEK